jgi:5-(carboxyamino)imidazole ribonucleotide synthase
MQSIKIGLLGGGQLAKMFIQSAVNYPVHITCMDADAQAPGLQLAHTRVVQSVQDYDAVLAMGLEQDVITIEVEAVNVDALFELERLGKKVYPQARVIKTIQDKGLQKTFFKEQGFPTASFSKADTIEAALALPIEYPIIQKKCKGGYDGKGVAVIHSADQLVPNLFPAVLEDKISIQKEIAVMVARNAAGEVRVFPSVECHFDEQLHLVDYLFCPSQLSHEEEESVQALAQQIITQLDMVGLLAIELFITPNAEILINELSPRPHNSGHHTIEANEISQFEQHLRSILNWPLGSTELKQASVMLNLIGQGSHTGPATYVGLEKLLDLQNVFVHLYGKSIHKPQRKMGHLTILDKSVDQALRKAQKIKKEFIITTNQ